MFARAFIKLIEHPHFCCTSPLRVNRWRGDNPPFVRVAVAPLFQIGCRLSFLFQAPSIGLLGLALAFFFAFKSAQSQVQIHYPAVENFNVTLSGDLRGRGLKRDHGQCYSDDHINRAPGLFAILFCDVWFSHGGANE